MYSYIVMGKDGYHHDYPHESNERYAPISGSLLVSFGF